MKVIKFDDIKKMEISPIQCYEWVNEALLHKNEALLPAKTSLKPFAGGFYNTMPVILPFAGWAGIKEVTRYPERKPSLDSELLLYDLNTGELLALMDADWITAMRTGAVAAHSIKLFAVKDFKTMGIIGLGNTARATMLVLASLYPDRDITVKLKKYKDQHLLFAKRFAEYENLHFEFVDTYEETIADSDVVVSAATVFDNDICTDEYFKEGILLVPVHTRGFTNCDLFFDKVYADDENHVKGFKNFDKFKSFAEVASVLRGENPGRESDKERILAYNIGIALHDIFFAGKIYEIIGDSCENIELNSPTEKFWV